MNMHISYIFIKILGNPTDELLDAKPKSAEGVSFFMY